MGYFRKKTKNIINIISNVYFYYFICNFIKKPKNNFIIFALGRSGTNLLQDLLNNHPKIYCDGEILCNDHYYKFKFPHFRVMSRSCIASINKKEFYGFHVKLNQLIFGQDLNDPEEFLRKLYDNGYSIIYLKRYNTVRQVISNVIAGYRGALHLRVNDKKQNIDNRIIVDCNYLIEKTLWREELKKTESKILEGIPHLKLIYENDLLSGSMHQNTANKVFKYLGLDKVKVKTRFIRTSKDNLKDIIVNYDEVVDALHKNSLSKFIDF